MRADLDQKGGDVVLGLIKDALEIILLLLTIVREIKRIKRLKIFL